jgi:hypothetical protein
MAGQKRVLLTGATRKVGKAFIQRFLAEPADSDTIIRALCHRRTPALHPRLEIIHGSIAYTKLGYRKILANVNRSEKDGSFCCCNTRSTF